MACLIMNVSIILSILLSIQVIHGKKGSAFINHIKRTATAPATAPAPSSGGGGQKYVFQTPFGYHAHGYGGLSGYGGNPWAGGYGGIGNFGGSGHIHPVPVHGVKALSIAYDPVSGVPYVCDPTKKDSSSAGATSPAAPAPAAGTSAGGAAPTGKRSEIKKGKIEVQVPDYPPCPDPKKTFPWSCLLGGSTKRVCINVKKAVSDASKRFWPHGGYFPPYFTGYPGFGAGYGAVPYWG